MPTKPAKWTWNSANLETAFQPLATSLSVLLPLWNGTGAAENVINGATSTTNQGTWVTHTEGTALSLEQVNSQLIFAAAAGINTAAGEDFSAMIVLDQRYQYVSGSTRFGFFEIGDTEYTALIERANRFRFRTQGSTQAEATGPNAQPPPPGKNVIFLIGQNNNDGTYAVDVYINGAQRTFGNITDTHIARVANASVRLSPEVSGDGIDGDYLLFAYWKDRVLTAGERTTLRTDYYGLIREDAAASSTGDATLSQSNSISSSASVGVQGSASAAQGQSASTTGQVDIGASGSAPQGQAVSGALAVDIAANAVLSQGQSIDATASSTSLVSGDATLAQGQTIGASASAEVAGTANAVQSQNVNAQAALESSATAGLSQQQSVSSAATAQVTATGNLSQQQTIGAQATTENAITASANLQQGQSVNAQGQVDTAVSANLDQSQSVDAQGQTSIVAEASLEQSQSVDAQATGTAITGSATLAQSQSISASAAVAVAGSADIEQTQLLATSALVDVVGDATLNQSQIISAVSAGPNTGEAYTQAFAVVLSYTSPIRASPILSGNIKRVDGWTQAIGDYDA